MYLLENYIKIHFSVDLSYLYGKLPITDKPHLPIFSDKI